jgi:AcrR family transcriptional regulator
MSQGREPAGETRQRLGREASTEALVKAARELFAEHGPSAVSLRDIGRRAGVSHGLIHHHIGSRDDLLRLVFATSTEQARALIDGATDPVDALARLRSMGGDREDFSRLLAWSLLEGRDPAEFHGRSSALEAVIATGPAESRELRIAVAASMVQLLGWKLFGEYAIAAAGLDESDRDELREAIERSANRMLKSATKPAGARR